MSRDYEGVFTLHVLSAGMAKHIVHAMPADVRGGVQSQCECWKAKKGPQMLLTSH